MILRNSNLRVTTTKQASRHEPIRQNRDDRQRKAWQWTVRLRNSVADPLAASKALQERAELLPQRSRPAAEQELSPLLQGMVMKKQLDIALHKTGYRHGHMR